MKLKLDRSALTHAVLRPFFYFGATIVAPIIFGEPGVVCITPVYWLVAIFSGREIARRSKSTDTNARLVEAALAGGLLGLLEAVVCVTVAVFTMTRPSDGLSEVILISLMLTIPGVLVCAMLASGFCWLYENGPIFPNKSHQKESHNE
jgi:hypothetical protein